MRRIEVNLSETRGGAERCPIIIESGLLSRLGELIAETAAQSKIQNSKSKIFLAVDSNIASTHGRAAAQSLRDAGLEVHVHEVVADEQRKSLETVSAMYAAMLAAKLERSSIVIALGGGIVGDAAGFAAATFMRGLRLLQAPTTLLAMVDAAIGGKNGVNWIERHEGTEARRHEVNEGSLIKNLIGAFWQPLAVISDPQTLLTLDVRNFRCGLAECVKHGVIADASLVQFIEVNSHQITAKDIETLSELIERSARIKAAIVEEDERESDAVGRRTLLNLGHTFAHSLESITELNLLHGEAVAIGLVAAMRCAIETNRMNEGEARRIRSLLEKLGLPTRAPKPIDSARFLEAMGHDKKVKGGRLRLILPINGCGAEIVDDVPNEVVMKALAEIAG